MSRRTLCARLVSSILYKSLIKMLYFAPFRMYRMYRMNGFADVTFSSVCTNVNYNSKNAYRLWVFSQLAYIYIAQTSEAMHSWQWLRGKQKVVTHVSGRQLKPNGKGRCRWWYGCAGGKLNACMHTQDPSTDDIGWYEIPFCELRLTRKG